LVTDSTAAPLGDRRLVTVVLRLVVDRQERLVNGEVLDAVGISRGRFVRWDQLVGVVRSCAIARREGPGSGAD
jgi:hypothetical protein